jgi:hypothetical protein
MTWFSSTFDGHTWRKLDGIAGARNRYPVLHTLGRYVELWVDLTNPRLAIYYYLRTITTINRTAVSLKR